MTQPSHLTIIPIAAPVQHAPFNLIDTLRDSLTNAGETLQDGDIIAISSKYTAISEGRTIKLDEITVSETARKIAERHSMNPVIAQLVINEADHVFGGIHGFLLTAKDGIISPNAGIDRSNIPLGNAVLFSQDPYRSAARIRGEIRQQLSTNVGVILTDSWLMPGRLGTTGVALAVAGFYPVKDERGKPDLFGNPLVVTRRSVADQLVAAAELVMGERDEATPFVLLRNTRIELTDQPITKEDVSIAWDECIYVESLTRGLLPDDLQAAVQAEHDRALDPPIEGRGSLSADQYAKILPFLDREGRVTRWTTHPHQRALLLTYLRDQFEIGRVYKEGEVNDLLKAWHTFGDHAVLRRELFEGGYLNREKDGSAYWRTNTTFV